MNSPKKLYGVLAAAKMVAWALLPLGLTLKYLFKVTGVATTIFGSIHGFMFLCYIVITIMVWINQQWSFGRGVVGLASPTIPFAAYPFEQNIPKAGLLDRPWRFIDDFEEPQGIFEQILAMIIYRLSISAFVILIVLAVVFALLLMAGPPTQWFSQDAYKDQSPSDDSPMGIFHSHQLVAQLSATDYPATGNLQQ